MPRDNYLTSAAALVAGIPFRLFARRAFPPPRKILILKPCCLSQVMLATPLLAALSNAYPKAQIDWAVCESARAAVATNPRVSELIDSGRVGLAQGRWQDVSALIARLRQEQYDTCFIPSRSALLSYIAWRAHIPRRVGLDNVGRGFAHTLPVRVPQEPAHEAEHYLKLAAVVGIAEQPPMEFFPRDTDRARTTERLVEELDWLGDRPLVMLHPGGGQNPVRVDLRRQWPMERFALLGNYLARQHGALVLLVGGEMDRERAEAALGLMSVRAFNFAGTLTLGELGALAEIADLYVGNDTGPTHVAAAAGCPTLAIFGPTDPLISRPFVPPERLATVACPPRDPFTWDDCVSVAEVSAAADRLLAARITKNPDSGLEEK
ncbi:MAG: glycosyltransferase family 9 protein [Anaerolineales bacterium]|nr:glycosyltransferase family 9 protein [Anaerolineales bacterium]MCB8951916.1 glycosyltransferase family 9 protein [Ardenticatenales bacterium]